MGACWICGKGPMLCNRHTYEDPNWKAGPLYEDVVSGTIDEQEEWVDESKIIDGVDYIVVLPMKMLPKADVD